MDEIGDVVFLAVVPTGQAIEWITGESVPENSTWVSGDAFTLMLRAFSASCTPVLSKLDVYSQTRIPSGQCHRILLAWPNLERRLLDTVAEQSARDFEHLLNVCATTPETELLIEGP